ncbi:cytochrome P450 [Laetiporus sulphureus 93-53]|uniref:Cytochrome P450 n=1 Tax=Laetiporus sulphureus 93-53 TaxID=1314785 RepID=A0A165E4P0_9APHY|nr:cytochrome P450 [Laetiporus sulphureus 93-53]KZT06233.1 cytochrome P450 [Laetiporus sulphureus 93-53]
MASAMKDHSMKATMPSYTSGPTHRVPSSSFLASSSGSATWLYTTLAIVLALLVLEQSVWRYKKRHLPGDKWTIPLIGKFADSMKPTMENYMKQWNSGALSAVSVFNIFIVMASTNEFARKILNSPTHAEPCLVHSAKQVLRPDNWVFLTGRAHVEYRRVLNSLFTRKALGVYVHIQDVITRKYFAEWLADAAKDPAPKPIMMKARDLNMDTSLRVFCGKHIPDHAAKEITDKYWAITIALELVNFPLAIPGTKVYRAIQARKIAMEWLERAAAESKKAMAAGGEPECLLDQWVHDLQDPEYKGRRDFSNLEMAMVVFSFLFASQDAMSSGLIYGLQHLADHPEVLAKVREEQERVRAGDYEKPITLEMMDDMPYLRAVVKESMRVKPPVTMVPYKTTKAFPISDDYTVPANSMVIPSFYNSLHDPVVFPEPEAFLPERWLDPEGSANQNPRNYLVFGSGPHKCIGLEYAMMNIGLVLADAAVLMNWEHVRTPESDKVQIIATLFPQDGLLLKLSPRQ